MLVWVTTAVVMKGNHDASLGHRVPGHLHHRGDFRVRRHRHRSRGYRQGALLRVPGRLLYLPHRGAGDWPPSPTLKDSPRTRSEPMNLKQLPWRILVAASLTLILAACDNGPFEKAGKAVDRAGEKAGDKVKEIVK